MSGPLTSPPNPPSPQPPPCRPVVHVPPHAQGAAGAAKGPGAGLPAVLPTYRDTDTHSVRTESRLLEGLEFCILAVDRRDPGGDKGGGLKAELETLIVAHGGTKVQNPTARTNVLLAGNAPSVRVENWKTKCESGYNEFGHKDVVHYKWLQQVSLPPTGPCEGRGRGGGARIWA